jgi:hypothetical protein
MERGDYSHPSHVIEYTNIRASFLSAVECGLYLTWKNNNTSGLFYKGVLIILPEKGQQQLLSCIYDKGKIYLLELLYSQGTTDTNIWRVLLEEPARPRHMPPQPPVAWQNNRSNAASSFYKPDTKS